MNLSRLLCLPLTLIVLAGCGSDAPAPQTGNYDAPATPAPQGEQPGADATSLLEGGVEYTDANQSDFDEFQGSKPTASTDVLRAASKLTGVELVIVAQLAAPLTENTAVSIQFGENEGGEFDGSINDVMRARVNPSEDQISRNEHLGTAVVEGDRVTFTVDTDYLSESDTHWNLRTEHVDGTTYVSVDALGDPDASYPVDAK